MPTQMPVSRSAATTSGLPPSSLIGSPTLRVPRSTLDLAFFDVGFEEPGSWTAARASNQLRYLRGFTRSSQLRTVIAGIPLDHFGWYLARDNLRDTLEAGALGLVFVGDADSADGRRYRDVAANYYDNPARLTP